ncbi:rhodanese-like domain-containing protein [Ramlibacter agri]|uniref:rhodanese-like domain-containing protein n=1 Tax=Ramlibacter agri TaxID=2728837 RepID=UPI00146D5907|nr:hypothetical protein [Ramlibacter agri]
MTLLAAGASVTASAQNLAAVAKACNAGADPAARGSTQAQINGVTTVSPREAKCLVDKLGSRLVIIQAMDDADRRLPNANALPDAGNLHLRGDGNAMVKEQYARLTGGDLKRPLLIYCHHASCPYSEIASKRAVMAGYENIFWMREGNEGWGKAGYAFGDGVVEARKPEATPASEIEACARFMREFPPEFVAKALAESDQDTASVERRLVPPFAESATKCLGKVKEKYAGNPSVQTVAQAFENRAFDDVARAIAKARAAVDADPSSFFMENLRKADADSLRDIVKAAHAVKTFKQTCGSFNIPIPSDPDGFNAAAAEFNQYVGCFNANSAPRSDGIVDWLYYGKAYQDNVGVGRYACSRWGRPNCIPDAAWQPLAAVLTPANKELVFNASDRRAAFTREREEIGAEMDGWRNRATAILERANRSESRSSGYSGGSGYAPPSYEPPQTTYRRPSNASAPGMR